tara:strand:+ start:702 stop:2216 length:1515 start_codon:yes stop_codon:yes gene_type:complete
MTDKTKLIKTKNNLLEFIEDKTKDIFMLLKTEKQIKRGINPLSFEEIQKKEKESEMKTKKWMGRHLEKSEEEVLVKKIQADIQSRMEKALLEGHGEDELARLYLSKKGIKFILDSDEEEIDNIDQNRIYSKLVTRYAQKTEFPWYGGLDDDGEVFITYQKYPQLRAEVVNFMSLLKQYLLLTMKEEYNILTLDIIPDSQHTFLAIFTMGNRVNEKLYNDAKDFFQKKLEDILGNVYIDKTSEHFHLPTEGLGNKELEKARKLTKKWFNGQKEEVIKLIKHEKNQLLETIKHRDELLKDCEGILSESNLKLQKQWLDKTVDDKRKDNELSEYGFELQKAHHNSITKLIDNDKLTLSKIMKANFEYDKKLFEHPFSGERYGDRRIEEQDPFIKIKPIFIERNKRQRFETVAEKRVKNIEKAIVTFNNFFSKTNVANYEFSKNDMIGIDERITKAVNTFRLNYEQFFSSNPEKINKEDSKVKKYKKNIDGTDPLIIKNIQEKMKGGD